MNGNEIMPDWGRSVLTEYWICLMKLCDYCLSGLREGMERYSLNVLAHTITGLFLLVGGVFMLALFCLIDLLTSILFSIWYQFNRD